jgi:hypothetical protein
MVPLKI